MVTRFFLCLLTDATSKPYHTNAFPVCVIKRYFPLSFVDGSFFFNLHSFYVILLNNMIKNVGEMFGVGKAKNSSFVVRIVSVENIHVMDVLLQQ